MIGFDLKDVGCTGGDLEPSIGPFLCGRCRQGVALLKSPLCRICGMPFNSEEGEDHTCGGCLISQRQFDLARSCGPYRDGLKDLIHWFKYRNLPQLADPLGDLLVWGIQTYFKDHLIDMMIPVPLHWRRMRSRGFNQAYLIARRAMNTLKRCSCCVKIEGLATKPLIRAHATRPQTDLAQGHRRKNVRHAFKLTNRDALEGKSILLVDDVYTTGATVDECARVLKHGGARWVAVLTLARAI